YRAYHVMQGIDEIIPVDVYVPGCPPSPEGLLQAILMIQKIIETENVLDADTREEIRQRMKKEVTETSPKSLLIAEQQALEATKLVQIPREPAAPKNPIVGLIEEQYKDQVLDVNDFRGDLAVTVRPDRITEICRSLKENPTTSFDLLSTITG